MHLLNKMISEFAKEKVFWTKKMNLRLVNYIHKKPNIWNPKHPKYTSVEHRDSTYAEFAAKYGYEFTGQAVKDRWTNIRSTFSNYLRKIKASKAKNDGEEYKVNWHLWDACQFLRKVNRTEKVMLDSVDMPEGENDFQEEMNVPETAFYTEPDQLSEKNLSTNSISCRSIAENLVTVFKGVQNDVFGLECTKYAKVGRAVTKKLSKMNSFEAAKVSQKIIEILCLYDENNPLNPNRVKMKNVEK